MPQRPKPYLDSLSRALALDAQKSKEALDLVKRYNEEYISWDELRRKDLPFDPDVLWALMKLARESRSKHFSYCDIRVSYNITNEAQRILHLLDTGASGQMVLDEAWNRNEMDRYLVSSLMEEAIASSQIEGAVTTIKEAKKMLREKRRPRSRSERMIVNDYLTMQRLKELKDFRLTIDVILELHRSLTEGILEDLPSRGASERMMMWASLTRSSSRRCITVRHRTRASVHTWKNCVGSPTRRTDRNSITLWSRP